MNIRILRHVISAGALLASNSFCGAVTIGPIIFEDQSDFDDNFEIITEANPGFSVDTNAAVLKTSSMSSSSAVPSSALYNSSSTIGTDVFTGDVSVSARIRTLGLPVTNNDKRFAGLLLMTDENETYAYYARMSLDFSTLEIGIINITNGSSWTSYASLSLTDVESGDYLIFTADIGTQTNTVTLAATIKDQHTGIDQTVSTLRNYVNDGLNDDGSGEVGLMTSGWQAVSLGYGSYTITGTTIPEPQESCAIIGVIALPIALLGLRRRMQR